MGCFMSRYTKVSPKLSPQIKPEFQFITISLEENMPITATQDIPIYKPIPKKMKK